MVVLVAAEKPELWVFFQSRANAITIGNPERNGGRILRVLRIHVARARRLREQCGGTNRYLPTPAQRWQIVTMNRRPSSRKLKALQKSLMEEICQVLMQRRHRWRYILQSMQPSDRS